VATSTTLILILGMAVVTYLTRLPLALLSRTRSKLPKVLDRVLEQIPVSQIRSVTIPTAGGNCLSLAGSASDLFADFRDDAVLESH